jgi:hypothetical protein
MKGGKLTTGVDWRGALKHKGVENKNGAKNKGHMFIF